MNVSRRTGWWRATLSLGKTGYIGVGEASPLFRGEPGR
jgi:hypothetical protein